MIKHYFLLFYLISSFLYSNGQEFKDTVFISKTNLDSISNSYDYIIQYGQMNHVSDIYKKNVVDFSTEFDSGHLYTFKNQSYFIFTEFNLLTGLKRNIILDKKSSVFYVSDYYDPKAIDDVPLPRSINKKSGSMFIKSTVSEKTKTYKVRLKKIWQKKNP